MNGGPQNYVVCGRVSSTRRLWNLLARTWLYAICLTLAGLGNALAQQAPPVIASQPQSTNVFLGSQVSFSVSASGAGPLRYSWSGPAGSIAHGTNQTLVLSPVRFQDGGIYSVKVSNSFGSVQSASAILSFK